MINAAANDKAAVRDMLNSLPSVTLRAVARNAATGTGLLAGRSAGCRMAAALKRINYTHAYVRYLLAERLELPRGSHATLRVRVRTFEHSATRRSGSNRAEVRLVRNFGAIRALGDLANTNREFLNVELDARCERSPSGPKRRFAAMRRYVRSRGG
jgi:hypothetical protein